ncbi:MAG: HAD family hydrolase [Clostridiales bacterium]|nr:HAD family hydrolase [Clostridiales bacterium]
MIKAVIFDMYETLITLFEAPPYFSAEMAADAGLSAEAFRADWYPSEQDRTLGRLSLEQALTPILVKHGRYSDALLDLMGEKRRAAKRASFDHLHPEILPMLQALQARGIRIGLITNCFLEEAEYIRQSELYPFFHTAMLSCVEGLAKPDRAIFDRCVARLGVSPGECLYVGDGGSHELETARELGMQTAQAAWYLKEGVPQPCGRKHGFTQLEAPMDVLGML